MRSHRDDCSFYDEEILHYLMNADDDIPKENVSVLCGLAVNVSPVPDAMFGNFKLRWCKNPIFLSNSTIRHINYETGETILNDNIEKEEFPDLIFSYVFRFNSVQFLLMCWDKNSDKINQNNIILSCQYPYYLMKANEDKAILPICTDELNYHKFQLIHVRWDGLFEVGLMRKLASGGKYQYKELYDKEWEKEEEIIKQQHPR